ncbi:hypothetical protein FB45DRAFT_1063211 [Roridomyces roridus]|uniref:Uncharacterized protein n=1 Tax=Roridomyces roridus TaxID=1738132 RepID=A0AAD7BED6_9AGAR|nr:hypothetical protein FB45DRAFT_1063211 [Roridomyces roridus]
MRLAPTLPLATSFDPQLDNSALPLDWVLTSGVKTSRSTASGLLSLPCGDGSFRSMNIQLVVVPSLSSGSDLVLGPLDISALLPPVPNNCSIPIAAHEYWETLTEGTLSPTPGSPPRFLDPKIYHVDIEKLTILDEGDGEPWTPEVPAGEVLAGPSTPTAVIRPRVEVDDAFDDLSPSKKARAE